MNRLGDTSAFVTPAGQLLLPGGVRLECIPSAYYLNSIQCPFKGALYRILCGVNRLGDSGVKVL